MKYTEKSIQLAKYCRERFKPGESAYDLAENILKQAGLLPPPPPPEVLVPDCINDDFVIAVDDSGSIYLYDHVPKKLACFWTTDCYERFKQGEPEKGFAAIKLVDCDSLKLPNVHWEKACWQVSDLRKMQAEFEKWQAEQSDPHSGYIVWERGELPEQFRDMGHALESLEHWNSLEWNSHSWGMNWEDDRYRMKRADYERLYDTKTTIYRL